MLKGVLNEEILVPRIRASLFDQKFEGFTIPVEGMAPRPPSGRFHPSSHPLWDEEKLYEYAKDPAKFQEVLELNSIFAVTQGSFWHAFIQNLGLNDGWLREMTPKAKYKHDRAEYRVDDQILGTGGYLDGVLNSDILPIVEDEVFEMKTMNSFKANKCPQGAPDSDAKINWLRSTVPGYYAQAQEYMRMTKYSHARFLILTLEYPFPMMEIVVEHDKPWCDHIAAKYKRVRDRIAAENEQL